MAKQELHVDQAKNVFPPFAMALLNAAQKQLDVFNQVQSELTKKATEINRHWADRGRSEASLASEFASKLAACRSVPDAMTAWQEWSSQRLERMAEDGKHLLGDLQEVVKVGTRLLPNGGWTSGPPGLTSLASWAAQAGEALSSAIRKAA